MAKKKDTIGHAAAADLGGEAQRGAFREITEFGSSIARYSPLDDPSAEFKGTGSLPHTGPFVRTSEVTAQEAFECAISDAIGDVA